MTADHYLRLILADGDARRSIPVSVGGQREPTSLVDLVLRSDCPSVRLRGERDPTVACTDDRLIRLDEDATDRVAGEALDPTRCGTGDRLRIGPPLLVGAVVQFPRDFYTEAQVDKAVEIIRGRTNLLEPYSEAWISKYDP